MTFHVSVSSREMIANPFDNKDSVTFYPKHFSLLTSNTICVNEGKGGTASGLGESSVQYLLNLRWTIIDLRWEVWANVLSQEIMA